MVYSVRTQTLCLSGDKSLATAQGHHKQRSHWPTFLVPNEVDHTPWHLQILDIPVQIHPINTLYAHTYFVLKQLPCSLAPLLLVGLRRSFVE
jgi:hypothetical protein